MRKLLLLLLCAPLSAQVAVTPLMGIGKVQFSDSTGIALSGAKLCTFAAGTTTPQTTYSESTGTTPNTNPVIADSGGFATVFITSSSYKFQLLTPGTDNTCSTGSTVWTIDNIQVASLTAFLNLASGTCGFPASAGLIRLCNTDAINWRNAANVANIGLSQGGTASTGTGNVADVLRYGTSGLGAIQSSRFIDFSAAPAQTGSHSCGNNIACLTARNAANNADITAVQVDGSNITKVGGAAGVSFNGGSALTTSNQTGTGSIAMSDSPTFTTTVNGANFRTSAANPSGVGVFRCSNNQTCVASRNAGNSADIEIASLDSSNRVSLAGASGGSLTNEVDAPKLKLTGGVNNAGAGMMHMRAASCTTTNATSPWSCTATLTWPGTWADTSYTAVCTAEVTSGQVFLDDISSKTVTQITYKIVNDSTVASGFSGTINCIGVHD